LIDSEIIMSRLATLFIVGCAIIIGVSSTLAATTLFEWSLMQGALVGLVSVLAVTIAHLVVMFDRDASARNGHIDNVQQDIEILSDRMALLDLRITRAEAFPVAALKQGFVPITSELTELGALVQQLAEQVKEHEDALALQARALPVPSLWSTLNEAPKFANNRFADSHHGVDDETSSFDSAHVHEAGEADAAEDNGAGKTLIPDETPQPVIAQTPPEEPSQEDAGSLDLSCLPVVLKALEEGRIDVHLQPIVQLPQRRVTHYEAMARLRSNDDTLLMPDEFLPVARQLNVSAALDALTLDRVLRIARRLKTHNRTTALFVNVAVETLIDPDFATDLSIRLDANSDLAKHVILEIAHDSVLHLTPTAQGVLMTLAEKGFVFSLDRVTSLRIDAKRLADLGFRYVKLNAALLNDPVQAARATIHPADMPDLLRRHGITLIATRIEQESQVADILDFDVVMAQGFLFGAARPVRPEVFAETAPSKRATIRGTDGMPVRSIDRYPSAGPDTRRGTGSIARRA
jgi:cyclic-di-GMP phosphodiesterase TipF (flagellum assembly factor)